MPRTGTPESLIPVPKCPNSMNDSGRARWAHLGNILRNNFPHFVLREYKFHEFYILCMWCSVISSEFMVPITKNAFYVRIVLRTLCGLNAGIALCECMLCVAKWDTEYVFVLIAPSLQFRPITAMLGSFLCVCVCVCPVPTFWPPE